MYRYGFYFDSTYVLLLIGFGITMLASWSMRSAYSRYSKIPAARGITGAEAAVRVLRAAGLEGRVTIRPVSGSLTDHYDPRTKTVNLSDAVYGQRSIAAVCVAAHECGHAIQDKENYAPLELRTSIVPAANIGSSLAWPIFLIGLLMSVPFLQTIGIALFSLAVLFQLITLPVEFNASSRAMKMLEQTGILSADEQTGARKVLRAAAMTYVAALASSVLQLLRLVMLSRGGRRSD